MSTVAVDPFMTTRRAEFPRLDDAVYLNAASCGPLPRRTRTAMDEVARMREAAHEFASWDVAAPFERCREAAARLIGADTAGIALAPNTSFGLRLGARLLAPFRRARGLRTDRYRVVVSDREFPANVLPWLGLEADGGVVDIVPTDERGLPCEDALLERLDRDDVALFALSAVQFASGYRAHLERFGRVCRERDILYVVDAIQAAGQAPIDVRSARIDILACGGQKWLCGPFGSGFVYVRDELRTLEPDLRGWMSTRASEDFGSLLDYRAPLFDDARRFRAGSLAPQDFAGLAESLELILELGVEAIREHALALQQPLLEWARTRPDVEPLVDEDPERRSAILCLRTPDAPRLHAGLAEAGVVCVLREGALRFSPHFYNTPGEIERVLGVLERLLP